MSRTNSIFYVFGNGTDRPGGCAVLRSASVCFMAWLLIASPVTDWLGQAPTAHAQPNEPPDAGAAGEANGSGHTDAGAEPWLTGAQLQRRLESEAGVTWASRPLREALRSLGEAHRVAILLDRNVDPGQPVDFVHRGDTLIGTLRTLAEQLQLGVSVVADVVYVGPTDVTNRLATVAAVKRQEVGQLPPPWAQRMAAREAWQWDELATPRELLEQLQQEAEVDVQNLDQLPHDLWPACSLPPLPWIDRLTLVLAGFELTAVVNKDGIVRLVPMPSSVTLSATYPIRAAVAGQISTIAERFPDASLKRQGNQLQVDGSVEDHLAIRQLLRGQAGARRPRSTAPPEKRYKLKVAAQPAERVIRSVAASLQLQVDFAASAEENLGQRVTFEVENATLDELLEAMLKPAGLEYEVDGETLRVW